MTVILSNNHKQFCYNTAPDIFADQSVRHQILPYADDIAFHVSLHVKVCMLLDIILLAIKLLLYTFLAPRCMQESASELLICS